MEKLPPETLQKLQEDKELLEAEFHQWLQDHFDSSESSYINNIVDQIDDEAFYKIAMAWALDTKSNKVYY